MLNCSDQFQYRIAILRSPTLSHGAFGDEDFKLVRTRGPTGAFRIDRQTNAKAGTVHFSCGASYANRAMMPGKDSSADPSRLWW